MVTWGFYQKAVIFVLKDTIIALPIHFLVEIRNVKKKIMAQVLCGKILKRLFFCPILDSIGQLTTPPLFYEIEKGIYLLGCLRTMGEFFDWQIEVYVNGLFDRKSQ